MWFDVQSALAEIEAGQESENPDPALATCATFAARATHVAEVASVATPLPQKQKFACTVAIGSEASRFGVSVAGRRLTWTGRVVSPDEWQRLSMWEQHGPNGRNWCVISNSWMCALQSATHTTRQP